MKRMFSLARGYILGSTHGENASKETAWVEKHEYFIAVTGMKPRW